MVPEQADSTPLLSEEKNRKARVIKCPESPGSTTMATSTQTSPAPGWMAGVTRSGGQGHLWRKAGFAIHPEPCFQNLDPGCSLVEHWLAGSFPACPGPSRGHRVARSAGARAALPLFSTGWDPTGGGAGTSPVLLSDVPRPQNSARPVAKAQSLAGE